MTYNNPNTSNPALNASQSDSYRLALQQWGINPELNLKQEAADLYLLMDLSLDFEDVKPVFNAKVNYLHQQLLSALLMEIGGELRHLRLLSTTRSRGRLLQSKPIQELLSYLQETTRTDTLDKVDRAEAWLKWHELYEKNGSQLLRTTRRLYRLGRWHRSYGGRAWAQATLAVLEVITGKVTPLHFVDTAFAIHHNCNIIFDKIWDVDRVNYVLSQNFQGNMLNVALYASDPVKELWVAKREAK